jgi:hypothetical protein
MHHPTKTWGHPACAALIAALALAGCNKPAPPASNAPAANVAAPAAPAAPAADTADAADAKAFLDGLYAHYVSAKDHSFDMFDKNVAEVFDPAMIQLLKDDAKANNGEPGVLDGDYLCNCQDYGSLKTTVTVSAATPTTAKAHAEFVDTTIQGDKPRQNDFDLVKVNGAWRVHDITDPTDTTQGSLRTALENEIKTLKGAKKGNPDEAP